MHSPFYLRATLTPIINHQPFARQSTNLNFALVLEPTLDSLTNWIGDTLPEANIHTLICRTMAAEATPQVVTDETATPAILRTHDGSPQVSVSNMPSAPTPAAPEANGESNVIALVVDKVVADIVDEVANSAEVSISGSDTEASRNDPAKLDDKGQSRTSSTKRLATFKSVSVNKTFLASKAASSTSAPKVGDKPTTPVPSAATLSNTSSTPKPRLVAKSAGGLRDASKSSLSQTGRPAPSASAVWNKNQPVPVADPKKFTDEELAKIGIHMASRLHTDDTKGQSNWADIDEDDEDWDAPDAFTWSDGTKTTIPHVDETPAIPEQPVIKEAKAVEKPQSPAPPSIPAATSSPAVKPGLPSGKGLVLKGGASSEKPTLVAKPPAPPTPVKSPWASLPPVSKVSPMEGAPEPPPRSFGSPAQAYVRGGPPPAAREIAADDFSRSPRRDNQQLFNSQSGRYEPVPERRGAGRTDYPQRQPAVLMRPMHAEGPAEPSAAFQTSHTSGGYGRRRGSSNVSGGSGGFQKPKFFDQPTPSEPQDARRTSLMNDSPTSPNMLPAPGPQAPPRQSPYLARASPAIPAVAPQQIPEAMAVAPQPNMEDTVEFQKKLMQERRAEAIKRRQEQEAEEEAAKKERLAKKLAALGPPPERRGTKKEETQEAPKATSERAISGPAAPQVQPKVANDASPAKAIGMESRPVANGVAAEPQAPARRLGSAEQALAPENKHGHPWAQPPIPPQPDPTLWGSDVRGSRNVWGAPNNDRTLGNGSFNAGFDARPSQTAATRGGRAGPGPIGPPTATSQARPSSSRQLGPIGPPSAPAQDVRTQNRNKWTEQVRAGDAAYYAEANQRSAALARDLKASGLDYADVQPQIKEHYTELDEHGNPVRRQVATYGSSATWTGSSVTRQDDRPNLTASHSAGRNGTAASQQSRFFPSSQNAQQPEPLAPDIGRPPEEDGHPAFDGDARHPHVSLPPRVSSPLKHMVKLPPQTSPASTVSQRSSHPASAWVQQSQHKADGLATGQGSRAVTTVTTMVILEEEPLTARDKLEALLGEMRQPTSVNSSSRTALAHPPAGQTATVSLPHMYAPPAVVDAKSYVTKTMDEDCFEEQEMGSLPAVHIPSDIPEALYNPAKAPPRQDRRLLPVVATSGELFTFQRDPRHTIVIQLPDGERKIVPVPITVRSPNSRRGGRPGARFGSSTYRGGNRAQESSTPYVADQASTSGSGPGNSRGRGRGHRARGDWARTPAPAIPTQ